MADELQPLILELVPSDGSPMGNGKLLAELRNRRPELTEDEYKSARDALVAEGVLGKGRGRGGSVHLRDGAAEASDAGADGFALTAPMAASAPAPRKPAARRRGKPDEPTQVLSYRHGETRANNPEVGMVHAGTDPDGEKTVWAHDPHLDPVLNFDSARAGIERLIDDALASEDPERMRGALQELKRLQAPYLNWTGKAERTSARVETVSLHVHERVDPATILAGAAKRLKGKDAASQWRQADLFAAPFENLPLRQALDFYSHEKGWSNRLVAGDSLLVMNSLLTKESMGGKVQMIYIDPPYGIKYESNFQPFTNKRDVKDRSDDDLTQEPEMIKAFRDTWELGIHSYLTYLRDRLILARELLTDSGSVFVQISDENLHHVTELLAEIFGSKNFISLITFKKTTGSTANLLPGVSDYLIWFAKDRDRLKYNQLYFQKEAGGLGGSAYGRIELPSRERRALSKKEKLDPTSVPDGSRIYRVDNLTSQSPGTRYDVEYEGESFYPKGYWKTDQTFMRRVLK